MRIFAFDRFKPGVTLEQANADVARMIPLAFDQFAMWPGLTRKMFEEAGHSFAKMGIGVSTPKLDLPTMLKFKDEAVDGSSMLGGELERGPAPGRPADDGARALVPALEQLDLAPGRLVGNRIDERDAGRKPNDDPPDYVDSPS